MLFGLGAVAGSLVTGHVANRIGFRPALRLACGVEIVAVALPALHTGWTGLVTSSLVMGAATSGVVPLALGRAHEVLHCHHQAQKRAWSAAITSFAVMQAAGAYGLSWLFARGGGECRMLFGLGAGTLALALVADLLTPAFPDVGESAAP